MATRAVSTVVTYRAWDTSANAPKTGDVANHTLRWIKDGTSSAPTNSPSEVDATNAKGTYKLTLTSTETDCTYGTLAGVSSTSNVSLFGIQIAFEYVPTASTTFGSFIGNSTAALAVDASGRIDLGKWIGVAPNALIQGRVDVVEQIETGTAQAGAAGTITLRSGASAVTGFYQDDYVVILAGTGVGQCRLIQTYVGGSTLASVTPNWKTNPDNTSVYAIIPRGYVDLGLWLDGPPTALTSGQVVTQVNSYAASQDPGTYVLVTPANKLTTDANGRIDLGNWIGVAPNALIRGRVDAVVEVETGTAQAGAAGSITLRSGAVATDSFFNDSFVVLLGGTGAGQTRFISGYTGSTKVATVAPNWATNPDATSVYAVIPAGRVDLAQWLGVAPSALVSGQVVGQVNSYASGQDPATLVWAQVMTELTAVPGITDTVLKALTWLFEQSAFKLTQTSATQTLFKSDNSTTLSTSSVSDDGTTFQRSKFS
jgi:hypothetical protein